MFVTLSEYNSKAAASLVPVLRAPEIVQPQLLIGDASVQSAASVGGLASRRIDSASAGQLTLQRPSGRRQLRSDCGD